jgi:hypothetical protein
MPFDNAARSDVEFRANTGQFKADMGEVLGVYKRTTGAMSSEALRAAVAQEKLDRAIKLHGPDSLAAKQATLAYRREIDALSSSAVRAGGGLRTAERDVEGFSRGAVVGSGVLHGFGRAAVFASTSLLGGYGLIYAVRQLLDAAKQEGVALAQVKSSLANAGLSWGRYGAQINEATTRLEHHTAFSREELDQAFATLITRTGNVSQAINLAALAADVARGRNISLADAVLLVIKAANGQAGALRRLGLDIHAVTTAQDKLRDSGVKASAQQKDAARQADQAASREAFLAAVREKYHGKAAAYLQTDAGKQALFNAELRESEGILGRGLLPALNAVLGPLTKYLEKANRTGKLQRDVNRAVKDGTEVVHGIRNAFHDVEKPIETVISLMGGLEHAVETALVLGAIAKVRKFAASFGLIRAASALTRTAIIRDAAVEGTALGGVIAGERTAAAGAAAFGLGSAIPKAVVGAGAGAGAYAAIKALLRRSPTKLGLGAGIAFSLHPDQKNIATTPPPGATTGLYQTPPQSALATPIPADLWQAFLAGGGRSTGKFTPTTGPKRPKPRKPPPPVVGLSFAAQERLLNAQIAGSQSGELAAYQAQSSQLNGLLKQPNLTPADRVQIKGELANVEDSIRSIQQGFADAAKQAADARKAAAAAREAVAQRRLKNSLAVTSQPLVDAAAAALTRVRRDAEADIGRQAALVAAGHAGAKTPPPPAKPSAVEKLIEFYKREARDARLTGSERARYKHLANAEEAKWDAVVQKLERERTAALRKARERHAQELATQRSIREQILQNNLAEAQLQETRAGANASALNRARAAEIKAELAILAYQRKELKGLSGLAKAQKEGDIIATQDAIAQLRNQQKPSTDRGADERQFLSSFADIVSQYAPNAFPEGKATTHLYESVHELRQIKKHLKTLVGGNAFPGSGYAVASASGTHA